MENGIQHVPCSANVLIHHKLKFFNRILDFPKQIIIFKPFAFVLDLNHLFPMYEVLTRGLGFLGLHPRLMIDYVCFTVDSVRI